MSAYKSAEVLKEGFFEKKFPKNLEVWKIVFTFAPLSAKQKRIVLKKNLSKIRYEFFEDIEQLRSFSSLEKREISNNTFEIRAKIYIQNFLQWRVWSWLRMNASGRPNTCKSRGIMIEACFNYMRPAHGCVTRMQPTTNREIMSVVSETSNTLLRILSRYTKRSLTLST